MFVSRKNVLYFEMIQQISQGFYSPVGRRKLRQDESWSLRYSVVNVYCGIISREDACKPVFISVKVEPSTKTIRWGAHQSVIMDTQSRISTRVHIY